MKYAILVLIALISACSTPEVKENSVTINDQEIQIAKELIQGAFDDLWGGVDSTKIARYHTDDFIILEHGEVWDNNRIKGYMRRQLANPERPKRVNKMDYILIEKYGSSIQIAYENTGEFYEADSLVFTRRWLESAIAIPTEDGWRLRLMHSTRISR